MELTIEQFEQIEQYLENQLSESDKLAFEASMAQDIELQKEIEIQRELRLGLRALAIEKQLKSVRQSIDNEQNVQVQSPFTSVEKPRKNMFSIFALAASIVLLVGVGLYFWQSQKNVSSELMAMANTELESSSLKSLPEYTTSKGTDLQTEQNIEWKKAMTLLKENKKAEAKIALEKISQNAQHRHAAKAKNILEKL